MVKVIKEDFGEFIYFFDCKCAQIWTRWVNEIEYLCWNETEINLLIQGALERLVCFYYSLTFYDFLNFRRLWLREN